MPEAAGTAGSTSKRVRPAAPRPRRAPAAGGLRERNKRDKLARIERAAQALFAQKGFEQTTTREIAQRARVGTGTLFLYAKDKTELLLRMFQVDCQRAVDETYASLPGSGGFVAEVMHTFDRMLDHYAGSRELARIFFRELLFVRRDDVGALVMDDIARQAALVERAQARGEIRADVAPMIVASNLWGVSYFALHAWLGGHFTKATARALMREMLDLQMQGLRPR